MTYLKMKRIEIEDPVLAAKLQENESVDEVEATGDDDKETTPLQPKPFD